MTSQSAADTAALQPRERIIVALDVDSETRAMQLVDGLGGRVGAFKVGLELFVSLGPRFVSHLVDRGEKVFLDLKFHDIPNTVARAASKAAELGVWMLNVHADGGREMMEAAAASVADVSLRANQPRPRLIAVTVLTSRDSRSLLETGHGGDASERVIRLARLADSCGLDGVVASPQEAALLRNAVESKDFLTVTPGIRNNPATQDDQKRVTTFGQAMANGSDYVVIGRPITGSPDPAAAVEEIVSEIAI
jgi:orotidine-5'-phosphate decarboxylase